MAKPLKIRIILAIAGAVVATACSGAGKTESELTNAEKAAATLDVVYKHYSAPKTKLLRETYPFKADFDASYLAADEKDDTKPYAYLWPYSGTFSGVNALFETTEGRKYRRLLEKRVLTGLDEYYDTRRQPPAYASYINTAPLSDRFYDDNVWIGIDFTDLYVMTGQQRYLDKAKEIWAFIESGTDDKLGGGIYWCEQKKRSKNTCSNAPGAVYALKLYNATQESDYLEQGKSLYEWTKENLRDPEDHLYWDNIALGGRIDKTKYAYNSGQMIQAGALLYKATGEQQYLEDAYATAGSAYDYFFAEIVMQDGSTSRILKGGNIWFNAVMMRGFIELHHVGSTEITTKYIEAFGESLDYAWKYIRDENGLFSGNWDKGKKETESQWLLDQAAMVEMYARMASVKLIYFAF